ncbi:hypothetical protein VPH35_113167 [Triticum aestivum]
MANPSTSSRPSCAAPSGTKLTLPLLTDESPGLLPLHPPPQPAGATADVVAAVVKPGLAAGRGFGRERHGARRGDSQDRQEPVRPARAPAAAGQPAVLRRQRPPPLPRLQAPPVQAGPPSRDRVTAACRPAAAHLLCLAAH